jgi:hypothetical protein
MEVFLARIRQLLPVLGSDILAPIAQTAANAPPGGVLFCRIEGAEARGQRTANGFVVFHGSTAVLEQRPSAETYPYVVTQRNQLIEDGTLIEKGGFLVFAKAAEFPSPSGAAAVIRRERKRPHRMENEGWKIPQTTRRTSLIRFARGQSRDVRDQ